MEFRPNTEAIHATLSKAERQAQGIFMTPHKIRQRVWTLLAPLLGPNPTILEPSFGSGEFLQDINPKLSVIGVEKNTKLFESAIKKPKQTLYNADFLSFQCDPVDLVVGNPPYFVTEEKDPACMKGRGNIFVQFIYKCLTKHLKPGGILAFVLPTSLYNCNYYEPCRTYIRENTEILHLENVADANFYDTAQQTMILIIRNSPCQSTEKPYFLQEPSTTMSPYYKELRTLCQGSTTLRELGFQVKTGDVVWNQNKEKLVDGPATDDTILVLYSGNIVDNGIALNQTKGDKKQYIKGFGRPPVTGPAILVARGYGNTSYNLSFAFVGPETTFYGENHVNVITGPPTLFPRMLASLQSTKTKEFLSMYVGNGALSKTELHTVLPIFSE